MSFNSNINEELDELLEFANTFNEISGGTISSINLKASIAAHKAIVDTDLISNKKEMLDKAQYLIDVWSKALERHNSQPNKFTAYDITTGDTK